MSNPFVVILVLNILFFVLPFTLVSLDSQMSSLPTNGIHPVFLVSLFFIPIVNFFSVIYLSGKEIEDERYSNGAVYRRALTVAFSAFYIYVISLKLILRPDILSDADLAISPTLKKLDTVMMFIISFYFGGGISKDIFAMLQGKTSDTNQPAPPPKPAPNPPAVPNPAAAPNAENLPAGR